MKTWRCEQTEKMVPFFTHETAFRQVGGKFVFRVNIIDFDLGAQVDFVKTAIKRDSVGHVSPFRTSDFFKNILITAPLSSKIQS